MTKYTAINLYIIYYNKKIIKYMCARLNHYFPKSFKIVLRFTVSKKQYHEWIHRYEKTYFVIKVSNDLIL